MAMDTRTEELMLSIETTLCKVTETKLKETAYYIKFADIEGLSKRQLIRNIRNYLDELCEKEENKAEELTALLEDILALLCGTPQSLEKTPDENA